MKNETTLSDLIFLSEQSENVFMAERLKELKELIETEKDNNKLAEELRNLVQMEDKELREKLLCVLRNNADKLNTENKLETKIGTISIKLDRKYEKVLTKLYRLIFKSSKEYCEWDIKVRFNGLEFNISTEEFIQIKSIQIEKIKQKQLEELTKLCNNN